MSYTNTLYRCLITLLFVLLLSSLQSLNIYEVLYISELLLSPWFNIIMLLIFCTIYSPVFHKSCCPAVFPGLFNWPTVVFVMVMLFPDVEHSITRSIQPLSGHVRSFFNLLALPSSWFQIFSSAPCSQAPSTYVFHLE